MRNILFLVVIPLIYFAPVTAHRGLKKGKKGKKGKKKGEFLEDGFLDGDILRQQEPRAKGSKGVKGLNGAGADGTMDALNHGSYEEMDAQSNSMTLTLINLAYQQREFQTYIIPSSSLLCGTI